MCARHSTRCAREPTFQRPYHSFRATAHRCHFSEKNKFFCSASVCLFLAGDDCQSSCTMYFVFVFFVTQKSCSDTSDVPHPWLWECMCTRVAVMCTTVYIYQCLAAWKRLPAERSSQCDSHQTLRRLKMR